MDAARLSRTLPRMAHEILERHPDLARAVLVGVRTRGVPLARRLAALHQGGRAGSSRRWARSTSRSTATTSPPSPPQPVLKGTDIPISIDGRTVVLVDDVLYTGRTVRAALDELIDFGRPARIELAVLVDRGHRELPIRADYAGKTLTTTRDEVVQVLLRRRTARDRVVLLERRRPPRPKAADAGARSGRRRRR